MARDARYQLLVPVPGGEPRAVDLPAQGEFMVGSDAGCELPLRAKGVEAKHIRIRSQGGFFVLEDLHGSGTTKVNGAPVSTHFLNPGDEVQVGSVLLRFQRAGKAPAPAKKAPSPLAKADPGQGTSINMFEVLSALIGGASDGNAGVFDRMLDGLLAAFDADRGVVFQPRSKGEFEALTTRERPGVETSEPISKTLIQKIAKEGRPQLLTSLETEELKQQIGSIAATVRSIVAAPIEIPGSKAGVVYLDCSFDRRAFQDGDEELLRSFARAAGDALALSEKRARMAEIQRREVLGQELLGESRGMKAVLSEIGKAASTHVSVLVVGETGTGKELVARALHRGSDRSDGPFVAVNCAAIPSELVESELFGHEKGAFSGATERRLGRFELAHGGTLFLDEVGELPLQSQGKLLRALQERVIERVGGVSPVPVDFRLVCATNVDMGSAVQEGKFREDLYYRIAVFPLTLPALRDREKDVVLIANAFLKQFAKDFRRQLDGLDESAERALLEYRWPGNIRELRNVIEQAVVRADGPILNAQALAPAMGMRSFGAPKAGPATPVGNPMDNYPIKFDEARKQFEKEFLTHKLELNRGNIKGTAEAVGLTRRALYLKCQDYDIDYSSFR